MIGNLKIRCQTTLTSGHDRNIKLAVPCSSEQQPRNRNQDDKGNDCPERSSKRQRRHDNGNKVGEAAYCTWQGKLCDWKNHAESECEFYEITCTVPGCTFTSLRRDMAEHYVDSAQVHVNLLVRALVEQQQKIDSMEKSHRKLVVENMTPLNDSTSRLFLSLDREIQQDRQGMKELRLEMKAMQLTMERRLAALEAQRGRATTDVIHLHLTSFCRQWRQRRPDALFDFVIYKPKTGPTTELLCGIPGPKRTTWEGGLFPLLMQWNDISKPPNCRFPPGFSHVNVNPTNGIVQLLEQGEFWDPDTSIPELLFDIQQLLVHPNPSSPSSDIYHLYMNDTPGYTALIQAQISRYSLSQQPSVITEASNMEFLRGALDCFFCNDDEYGYCAGDDLKDNWWLVSDRKPNDSKQSWSPQTRPTEPIVLSTTQVAGGDEDPSSVGVGESDVAPCPCSCCAWGSSSWDSRHEMRFLFGCGR